MSKKCIRMIVLVLAVAVTAVAVLSCSQEQSSKPASANVELCITADKSAQVATQTEAVHAESKLDAAVKTVSSQLSSISVCSEKQQDINRTVKPVAFAPLIYSNDDDAVPG